MLIIVLLIAPSGLESCHTDNDGEISINDLLVAPISHCSLNRSLFAKRVNDFII